MDSVEKEEMDRGRRRGKESVQKAAQKKQAE